ncbi:MAG: hypothetical protein ACFHU9_03730 [Fluviicola sp.]
MNTGLHVKTGFFPLAWILYFVTPTIEINGEKHKKKWGQDSFALDPGEHHVKISFPYMGRAECGANDVTVTLADGETKRIMYGAPFFMFSKGNISVH